MIDFEWYRSFVYIYKYNSVSEAARTRIMTQPAMSQHLASLESAIGESLFVRKSRKMIPTERGKALYSQLVPFIESLEAATLQLKNISSPIQSVLRIGSTIEFFHEMLLPKLQELNMHTVSYFGTADRLLDLLKKDTVDVIFTSKKYSTSGIEYVPLFEEKFVVTVSTKQKVKESINHMEKERWLISQNWLSYGLDLPIIRGFWREHFKKRPSIKPVHVIPNLHLILKAIENGVGISLLPTYLLKDSIEIGKIKIILSDLTLKNKLFLAYQTKHKHHLGINEFLRKIQIS